ncbi:MAG TPA: hypothetical protein VHF51_13255 [Solirubrobacteraceae bacterium]|nr:hypothetical protein [Solirubrobacteraceae bacterium]
MSTAFDTPTAPLAELSTQLLEASARAITVSADLYAQVVASQADATAGLVEAYLAAGRQGAGAGQETVATIDETATKVARGTARATRRATKRTAGAARKAAGATRKAAAAPAKAVEAPVAGYDDLTAEELVAKLPELSQAQLAQVAAYEQAHDARATVLERVAALTGPEPVPGYDELTADDAQKLVTGGDAELAAAVRDYERRHKGRTSVIDAAVRNADAS